MPDDTDVCGSTDTATGEPCQRPAGWGTDGDEGHCATHVEDGEEPGGRPSKFTDERARDAITAARQSKSEAGCARAAGVSHTTLQNWKEVNPTFIDESGRERAFFAAYMRARADGETILVQGGLRDGDIDTSMAKFLLATSFDYTKTEKREITGEAGGPVEIDVTNNIVGTGDDGDE
ncbi:hypothetical protein [Salinilacihabitans rarus]|uniref:hypothetical protein n=1 Tax=Salinilacihabitans rarus TaxID=2961596 RepID=UPI0020C8BEFA|nr:hypothetical protein [Salinilacihabitans rarus]